MIGGDGYSGRTVVLLLFLLIIPGPGGDQTAFASPVVSESSRHDLSAPLRSINPQMPVAHEGQGGLPADTVFERPLLRKGLSSGKVVANDSLLQDWQGTAQMPAPLLNFDGISAAEVLAGNGFTPYPPDPNGDVGPGHYVQWVNLSFAIWDKTGKRVFGPVPGNTLWAGFGGPCENTNDGDPVALYDRIAGRWVMSQFSLPNYNSGQGPFYQCIAVSQTGDPTGSWYRYEFKISDTKLNDYPKLGVWPDGYYLSVNQFQYDPKTKDFTAWGGAGVVAFERDQMLQGLSARQIYMDLYSVDPNLGNMLPSHLNSPNLPPAGSPNYFIQVDDNAWGYPHDQLEIWKFSVDWTKPSSSSFVHAGNLATEPFDSNMCNYEMNCVPQPRARKKLDAISERLMYRLQYRNFGDHEALVANHTVDADGSNHAGVRWYELRNTGSGWFIRQQGTYAPDANHRWMASIAMDGSGNIAIGYSVSGKMVYPSVRYTGRLAGDPLNTLPQNETTLIKGKGMQTDSSRWGDYSTLSVDPADDCTFWYTQEYYDASYRKGWKTRIGAFRFPSCVSSRD